VIVAGGDGSIHEAVNGMMRASGSATLGVIPIGTGNDFAKACNIPLYWEDAGILLADRLRNDAPSQLIDVGQMNDRYFVNSAGIGFDARVSHLAQHIRLPIGDLVYLVAVVRAIRHGLATPDVRVRFADESHEGPLTLVSINNGDWVGGMFQIAPMARNYDGELDLILATAMSRRRLLSFLPRLFNGTHLEQPEVTHARIKDAEIDAASPLVSHLDGEIQPPCSRFSIKTIEGGLRLL
jgi:YegS/Rv2252/BmrU family lipid kinase